ncbi:MAG: aldolase/citrate lyase family protein [Actinobacteria bacterium]|nr:aldolase/citrate lyase family protein [Actinomycetota bacterium]
MHKFTDPSQVTIGTFLGMGAPMAAEIAAVGGADWVLFDLEHGGGSEDLIGPTVVAGMAYGIPTLVRVESMERIRIGRALDAGASGVMIPRIETPEQVSAVVKHMSYPPFGDRGVATYNRSAKWGRDLSGLTEKSKAACIIQIETLKALENVDAIAKIDGADLLFVGPLDLSFALGVPRDFKSPKFLEATAKVVAAANANNKVAGILAADATAAATFIEQGFKFIAIGSDATLLAGAITNLVTQLKKS